MNIPPSLVVIKSPCKSLTKVSIDFARSMNSGELVETRDCKGGSECTPLHLPDAFIKDFEDNNVRTERKLERERYMEGGKSDTTNHVTGRNLERFHESICSPAPCLHNFESYNLVLKVARLLQSFHLAFVGQLREARRWMHLETTAQCGTKAPQTNVYCCLTCGKHYACSLPSGWWVTGWTGSSSSKRLGQQLSRSTTHIDLNK